MSQPRFRRPFALAALALLPLAACGDSSGPGASFLNGTETDPRVGIVLNGPSRTITLFHVGSPATLQQIPLGASDAITVTGAAVHGRRAIVPLGNAASVAVVDLHAARVTGVHTFAAGNATGAAWVDDNTVIVANLLDDYVGRIRPGQAGGAIADTAHVAPAPTAIAVARGRAFVVSGNLDDNFVPLGNGIVSVVDPQTMRVVERITVGPNPQAAATGPDGKVYVLNTGNYSTVQGSVSIIDPQTLVVEATVPGFGLGPGAITIGADGLAYVSSYMYGTAVWDTRTRQFVRGPAAPLCAAATLGCRGAAHASAGPDGTVYQAYLGTATDAPRVFTYTREGGTYGAAQPLSLGTGPLWVDVRSFR